MSQNVDQSVCVLVNESLMSKTFACSTHMGIKCVIFGNGLTPASKLGFAPKFSSDIRSAAGELFTGPHQSLPEMSDGPTSIGELP